MLNLILWPYRAVGRLAEHALATLLIHDRDLHFLVCPCGAFDMDDE